MNQMLKTDLQTSNEYFFAKKHIDKYIRTAITESTGLAECIKAGMEILRTWLGQEYSPDKQARLNVVEALDAQEVVLRCFIQTAYCTTPQPYVGVASQVAHILGFDDRVAALQTAAEILAVLAGTGAYVIEQAENNHSLWVTSRIQLPANLVDAAIRAEYLPPMVTPPKRIRKNNDSPYFTIPDNVMLGRGNYHSGNLALDVIDTQNQVPLSLSREFLEAVPEVPTFEVDTLQKQQLWTTFVQTSQRIYQMLFQQGNEFYLTNKVDKRGRLYAQGYHVTTQGAAFKKAMIELARAEIVEGVPQ